MMLNKKLILAVILSALITGCATPGSHIPIGNKSLAETNESPDISSEVKLYPLTASSVSLYSKGADVVSRENPNLDLALAQYEYKVGSGDVLSVTVWDHPDLTIPAGSFRSASEAGNWVHADGSIFYPYIGTVKVAGKTVREIRIEIARRLARFIESPQVDVNVAAFRSQKTYITGEVNAPGQQAITNIPLTILDAINKAGGLAENADWHNTTLTRFGKTEPISLYALMQRGDLTQNRLLQADDIIHVPRNDKQKIFVMGEVRAPQLLRMDRSGMTLTEALSSVGGINELAADATGVFVIRGSENKKERMADIYQLNIKDATALIVGTEFNLQSYDIVYVTAAPVTRWNRIIAQLIPTISGFNEITEAAFRIRTWP